MTRYSADAKAINIVINGIRPVFYKSCSVKEEEKESNLKPFDWYSFYEKPVY